MLKRFFLMMLASALLAAPLAHAGDWRGFGPLVQGQGQPMKKDPPPGQQFQRGDRGHSEQDRRNQGRLTQEERRDLHRDLDRANREIYRRH